MKNKSRVFVNGPIAPNFIAECIAKHSEKKNIGAHAIFLGQVRSDLINNNSTIAIEYTAYTDMAESALYEIRESAFKKFDLICMHIYISLGIVKSGEMCLFVFVSSKHRRSAFDACNEIVEQIKTKVPIWGKEIFNNQDFVWKENQF